MTKLKCYLLPPVLLLAMALVCSARNRSIETDAKLTYETEIMNNKWIQLRCDYDAVGLLYNYGVFQLELSRKLNGSSTEEKIATFRTSSQPNPGLSIGAKFKDNKRWTIKMHDALTENFYLTATINRTRCSDAGDYYCIVSRMDQKDVSVTKGQMYLPSVAEITKIEFTGNVEYRHYTEAIKKDDVIIVDCSVKGPELLELTWKKDWKIIGVNTFPPEVLRVVNHDPIPVATGDECPQYEYHKTLVFKARKNFRYECSWSYKRETGNAFFDMDEAGWTWTGSDTPVTDPTPNFGVGREVTFWYILVPLVGVVALGIVCAGIYFLVVSRNRKVVY